MEEECEKELGESPVPPPFFPRREKNSLEGASFFPLLEGLEYSISFLLTAAADMGDRVVPFFRWER